MTDEAGTAQGSESIPLVQGSGLVSGSSLVPSSGEPDWEALADRHERDIQRRKRLRTVLAVVAATTAIGGLAGAAVLLSGSDRPAAATATAIDGAGTASPDGGGIGPALGQPADSASPSASAAASASVSPSASAQKSATAHPSASAPAPQPPAPSAPAPTSAAPKDPLTVISDVHTDGAPLDPATLFPAGTLSVDGRTWTRIALDSVTPCWQKTTGGLGDVITGQSCRVLLRATYANGNSAVTIGVAAFDTKAQADAAQQTSKGQLQGLVPAGSISFCTSPGCANTHAAIGRYTYYSVSGTLRPGGTAADPAATAAGPGLADYARTRLLARGQGAA